MSVPASKRREASMEFVHNWRVFCAHLNRWAAHLPKRYSFRLVNPMLNHAHEALYHLNAANRTYVKDEASFSIRRAHLINAGNEVDHVETMLEIIQEIAWQDAEEQTQRGEPVKAPNANAYAQFADAIEHERKLIAGVKARDTKRLDSVEQAVGDSPNG